MLALQLHTVQLPRMWKVHENKFFYPSTSLFLIFDFFRTFLFICSHETRESSTALIWNNSPGMPVNRVMKSPFFVALKSFVLPLYYSAHIYSLWMNFSLWMLFLTDQYSINKEELTPSVWCIWECPKYAGKKSLLPLSGAQMPSASICLVWVSNGQTSQGNPQNSSFLVTYTLCTFLFWRVAVITLSEDKSTLQHYISAAAPRQLRCCGVSGEDALC